MSGEPTQAEIEAAARFIAASKMKLVKDPTGARLPEEIWAQAVPQAEAALRAAHALRTTDPAISAAVQAAYEDAAGIADAKRDHWSPAGGFEGHTAAARIIATAIRERAKAVAGDQAGDVNKMVAAPPADQAQADAREVLASLEWSGGLRAKPSGYPCCPVCDSELRDWGGKHAPDCRLAAALRDPAPDAKDTRIRELEAEVERLKREADGEFVRAAVSVMEAYPGYKARDYAEDGITADDFARFLSEDMQEAWNQTRAAQKRSKTAETRAQAAEAALATVREALEPLAQFVEGTDKFWDDKRRIATLNYDFDKLTVGLFRRAREALARTAPDAREGQT